MCLAPNQFSIQLDRTVLLHLPTSQLSLLPVLESLPVLLLLAVLSPRMSPGEMPLKLLALVMAGRGASRLELSELSVLLHGRGSQCRGSVSVSELLCRLAPDRPARNLDEERECSQQSKHFKEN